MEVLKKLKDNAKKLKNEIVIISLAFKDKRTPIIAKIIIGLTVSYALSPIDLIPDFIPVLGYLDDLIILPLLIILSIKMIPKQVLIECREMTSKDSPINKKIGILSAIFIILIWLGLFIAIIVKFI